MIDSNIVIDSNIPPAIASIIQDQHGVISAVATTPGMSGARVYRCLDDRSAAFALRRWPASVSQKRVAEIHRVQAVAHESGCLIVPTLLPITQNSQTARCETVHYDSGACWELATWVPGTKLPVDAPIEQIVQGASAIRTFHLAVNRLGTRTMRPLCLQSRIDRIAQLNRALPEILATMQSRSPQTNSPQLADALMRSHQTLSQNWSSVAADITRSINRYAEHAHVTQYVLRDVHRDHILFSSNGPTGLVDFDSIRIDMPLTDLVRWGGSFIDRFHFASDQEEFWNTILAGYNQKPISLIEETTKQIQFAKMLHRSFAWIALSNWLVWILKENRTFASQDHVIAERIDRLVNLALVAAY